MKNIHKNAIILAAGRSNEFAPLIYEKPKGLFQVRGEILIERQINQLFDAGVDEIFVIVGYMKEKFFYLEEKFKNRKNGVKLLVNNDFELGNICSIYVAREHLNNTFICCADQYFINNPFIDQNFNNISYRACLYKKSKFKEFGIRFSDIGVITNFDLGGKDSFAMVGHAYFNTKFSKNFVNYINNEINDFGIKRIFWEEFYGRHIEDLSLFAKIYEDEEILEFDSIEDLLQFDSDFFMNIDSNIIQNITKTLKCKACNISNIKIINAGLTNASFSFCVDSNKYVYRHPGTSAYNLTDRKTEIYANSKAKELGLDNSFIFMNEDGWKISNYIEESRNCDFFNTYELKTSMKYLRTLHSIDFDKSKIKIFDNFLEGKKLMQIASISKGNLFKEFADIIKKVEKLNSYILNDAKILNIKKVLCHNDTYEPNFLINAKKDIYLIDWEYAGLNFAANDLGSIICRNNFTDDEISMFINEFLGYQASEKEKRFYRAFIVMSAWYWFCWGLYKGSVGDDDSFFFLPSYRTLIRFLDLTLKSYE